MPIDRANPRNPTRRYVLELPPDAALAALGWGELTGHADEYRMLLDRQRQARAALEVAAGSREAAIAKDRKAAASALRTGKPDPGIPATAKADRALEKARRDLAVIEQAVTDAEDELIAQIVERRPALAANIADARQQARAAIPPAAESLANAVDTLADLAAVSRWLTAFPSPQGFKRARVMLPGLERHSGEPHSAREARAALAALAQPPPPPPTLPEPEGAEGEHPGEPVGAGRRS